MRSDARALGPWAVWPPGYGSGDEDRRSLFVLSALRGISPRNLIPIAFERGSAAATLEFQRNARLLNVSDPRKYYGNLLFGNSEVLVAHRVD